MAVRETASDLPVEPENDGVVLFQPREAKDDWIFGRYSDEQGDGFLVKGADLKGEGLHAV